LHLIEIQYHYKYFINISNLILFVFEVFENILLSLTVDLFRANNTNLCFQYFVAANMFGRLEFISWVSAYNAHFLCQQCCLFTRSELWQSNSYFTKKSVLQFFHSWIFLSKNEISLWFRNDILTWKILTFFFLQFC
jgi:hypothetical protein